MAEIHFTPVIQRHIDCPSVTAEGTTVREVLDRCFEQQPALRSYLLDDQGALRKHVAIFVDGQHVTDRDGLGDSVGASARIDVLQALSGG